MRKITEEEFDQIVLKEKERQKSRKQHKRPKDTSVEPEKCSADIPTLEASGSYCSLAEQCASERLHVDENRIGNSISILDNRIHSYISHQNCDEHILDTFSTKYSRLKCLCARASESGPSSVECSNGDRDVLNRYLKRSKTLHKTKHASLMIKKLANKDVYCDIASSTLTAAETTNGPSGSSSPISILAFQSAKPTAFSVAQQKQERSDKTHCGCCNGSHCYDRYPHQQGLHSQITKTNHIFKLLPPKLRDASSDEDEPRHRQDFNQRRGLSPTVTTRKRLKTRKRCNCRFPEGSDLRKSFRGVKLFEKASALSQEIFSSPTTTSWSISTPTRFRHPNLSKVFLILIMLISLAPVVCGHNVNLNNSDKIAPPKQQHIHQQYHHEPHDGASSGNNIRREMNARFSNFGNGFSGTDDTVLADGEIGESSRRFVGDDSLGTSSDADVGSSDDAGSETFVRSGCHSCQMREKVKADNLASIKRHILYRLKLKDIPNITAPVVPPEIVEKFYKSHYQNGGANGGGSAGDRGRNRSGSGNGGSRNRYSDENTGGGGSGARYSSTFYDNMQGDDPRAYYDTNYDGSDSSDNFGNGQYAGYGEDPGAGGDYEEDFFSVVNSLYVFPTTQHPRHNRKTDILHFPFTNDGHSIVSQATLHIFLRSWSWVRENLDTTLSGSASSTGTSSSTSSQSHQQHGPSNLMPSNAANRNLDIVLKINNVLRHNNVSNNQKGNELRYRIPRTDNGIWITVDVTDMVTEWYNNASTNHGVMIKTKDSWMKHFIVLDDSIANKTFAPYIEVMTKDNRKRRSKRNTSLNCSEGDNEVRCCRYPLEVNFRQFNWEWIIAPQSFNAYFCNGECKLGFIQKYPHTHLMQMSTAPQPCCSPTKMSPVSLLYFNTEHILVMSTIPNMAVEKCSCS